MITPLNPILTAEQVAELLHCSRRTVEDHARSGTLPGAKFGDGWIFVTDLLMETIKQISLKKTAPEPDEAPQGITAVLVPKKPKRKKIGPLVDLSRYSQHTVSEVLGPQ